MALVTDEQASAFLRTNWSTSLVDSIMVLKPCFCIQAAFFFERMTKNITNVRLSKHTRQKTKDAVHRLLLTLQLLAIIQTLLP